MGTRADFYVGNGSSARWKASIALDGYPEGIDGLLLGATSEEAYLTALRTFLADRRGVSGPDHGWPWPWDDSRLTDYAYCFVGDHVEAYAFGHGPFDPQGKEPEAKENEGEKAIFPDMKHVQNIAWDDRSGLIVIARNKEAKT